MIHKLEMADAQMRKSGLCDSWFDGADEVTLGVSGRCNGALFEQLLQATGYGDAACVELLREGNPVLLLASSPAPGFFL